MSSDLSRREFLTKAGLAALTLPFIASLGVKAANPIAVKGLKVGYASITWNGNDVQAIKDISSLGFKGIQLRANVVKEYGSKPAELQQLLRQYKLELPMFSSGNANINTGKDEEIIQMHVDHARFVKALGGEYIQITNTARPKTGNPSEEDLRTYGQLLNEIGKRTNDVGVQVAYHNHMHQLGETPHEVEVILENCKEENVKLLLDVAHYHQGGGDPVKAIAQYKDRIRVLHLKDVRPLPEKGPQAYSFVELGQGKVNLPGVFKALADINFKGWGIVELDAVPDQGKTPLQCGQTSRAYLQSQGIKV
ncbi:sugar phosphate isomerase/epimerase [Pontibacter sp. SGAir0037]|uniref:sugar phosphate isomerase/epimerase family protein n=1 Tax=Pontibacter sp. SGAir0037 TaxID=2571030 RepID=UPI0010CD0654|nr:sugar phosphate isomerase/epimerase [Pontibacter sp. SGAir0037]QCR23409.1 xylose isomerase [Pontibacter sp. SGAir0037]